MCICIVNELFKNSSSPFGAALAVSFAAAAAAVAAAAVACNAAAWMLPPFALSVFVGLVRPLFFLRCLVCFCCRCCCCCCCCFCCLCLSP